MVLLNGLRIGIGEAFLAIGFLMMHGTLAVAFQPPAAGGPGAGNAQPSVAAPAVAVPNVSPSAVPVPSPPRDLGAADDTFFEIIFSGGILGIGIC